MDFLTAVTPRTCVIQLAGEVINVSQCPLLSHYMLRTIAVRLTDPDPVMRLDATFDYISVATGIEDLSRVEVEEIPFALDRLLLLNDHIELLPWQQSFRKDIKRTSADYDHRELAVIVNTLATAYGWSEKAILSLPPEVAACYVQEILIRDWEDREYMWKLSEVAYDGKTGKYKPFPQMFWYGPEIRGPKVEEAVAKVPKRFMPSGVIIRGKQN